MLHLHLDAVGGLAAHDEQVLVGHDQLKCVAVGPVEEQPFILSMLLNWTRTSAESFEVEPSLTVDSKRSSRLIVHSFGGNHMFSEKGQWKTLNKMFLDRELY